MAKRHQRFYEKLFGLTRQPVGLSAWTFCRYFETYGGWTWTWTRTHPYNFGDVRGRIALGKCQVSTFWPKRRSCEHPIGRCFYQPFWMRWLCYEYSFGSVIVSFPAIGAYMARLRFSGSIILCGVAMPLDSTAGCGIPHILWCGKDR